MGSNYFKDRYKNPFESEEQTKQNATLPSDSTLSYEDLVNAAKQQYLQEIGNYPQNTAQEETQEINDTSKEQEAFQSTSDTFEYVGKQFQYGVGKGIEGLADFILGLGAKGVSLLGADTSDFEDYLSRDITKELMDNKYIGKLNDLVMSPQKIKAVKALFSDEEYKTLDTLRESSYIDEMGFFGQVLESASQSVGMMVPAIATGVLTGGLGATPALAEMANLGVFGLGAAGGKMEEELQKGSSLDKALAKGTVAGAIEVATEKIGGAITEKVAHAGGTTLLSKLGGKLGIEKTLSKVVNGNRQLQMAFAVIGDMIEEGGEEILGNYMEYASDKLIFNENVDAPTLEENLLSFCSAMLSSGVFAGADVMRRGKSGYYYDFANEDLQNTKKDYRQSDRGVEATNTFNEKTQQYRAEMESYLKEMSPKQREAYIQQNPMLFKNYNEETGKFDDIAFAKANEIKKVSDNTSRFTTEDHTLNETNANMSEKQKEFAKDILDLEKRANEKNGLSSNIVFEDNTTISNETKGSYVNGYYSDSEGALHVNMDTAQDLNRVFVHEITHSVEWTNGYYKVVKDLVGKEEFNKVKSEIKEKYSKALGTEKTTGSLVYTETVAQLLEDKLGNRDFVRGLYAKDKSLFGKIRDFFVDNKQTKLAKKYANIYEEAMTDANAQNVSLGIPNNLDQMEDTEVDSVLNTIAEKYSKSVNDNGTKQYNLYTFLGKDLQKDASGNYIYTEEMFESSRGWKETERVLKENGHSKQSIKETKEALMNAVKLTITLSNNFSLVGDSNAMHLFTDENGHIIYSAWVKNGEYAYNVDLTTICKKRENFTVIMDSLLKGLKDNKIEGIEITKENIVQLNQYLKDNGLETACPICFVDTKRYNIDNWSKSVKNKWAEVKNVYKDLMQKEDFKQVVKEAKDVVANSKTKKANNEAKKLITDYLVKNNLLQKSATPTEENTKAKGTTPQQNAVANIAFNEKLLTISPSQADIMSSDYITKIKAKGFDEFESFMTTLWGSATPKILKPYTPYNMDVLLDLQSAKDNADLVAKTNAVGGFRLFSFSDFKVENFFDYIQLFSDAHARGLRMQCYTKEAVFALLFGKLGGKINLSVMPALNTNITPEIREKLNKLSKNSTLAKYELSKCKTYDQVINKITKYNDNLIKEAGESQEIIDKTIKKRDKDIKKFTDYFKENAGLDENGDYCLDKKHTVDADLASFLLNDKEYSKYCGQIIIGVSNKQMLKALADPKMSMVIPYHLSSLNPLVAALYNVNGFTDYTSVQRTMYGDNCYKLKKENGKITYKLDDNGNKVKAKKGNAIPVDCEFDFYKAMENNKWDAKKTANEYLKWCKDNNFIGKFGLAKKELMDFTSNENYYKLLVDFTAYDCDGNIAPQIAIKKFDVTNEFITNLQNALKDRTGDIDKTRKFIGKEETLKDIVEIFGGKIDDQTNVKKVSQDLSTNYNNYMSGKNKTDYSSNSDKQFSISDLELTKQELLKGTKDGYIKKSTESNEEIKYEKGDALYLGYTKSNTTKRVFKQLAPTITTKNGDYAYVDSTGEIRRFTPKERWMLMGFTQEQYDKASSVVKKTALNKQAGNSISVNVLEAMIPNMNLSKATPVKLSEYFAGIGAIRQALLNQGYTIDSREVVEIDKNAIKSYNALYGTNVQPTNIIGYSDTMKKQNADILLHGSPCQNNSFANHTNRTGMEKGSNLKSALLWESVEAIKKNKPKIVVWENVANAKNMKGFNEYLSTMESIGYTNSVETLNTKDFGIPQQRNRLFVVSTLDNTKYIFPTPTNNTPSLMAFLEGKNNDAQYSLSDSDGSNASTNSTSNNTKKKADKNIISMVDVDHILNDFFKNNVDIADNAINALYAKTIATLNSKNLKITKLEDARIKSSIKKKVNDYTREINKKLSPSIKEYEIKIKNDYTKYISDLKTNNKEHNISLTQYYNQRMAEMKAEHNKKLASIKTLNKSDIASKDTEIKRLNNGITVLVKDIDSLYKIISKNNKISNYVISQLTAEKNALEVTMQHVKPIMSKVQLIKKMQNKRFLDVGGTLIQQQIKTLTTGLSSVGFTAKGFSSTAREKVYDFSKLYTKENLENAGIAFSQEVQDCIHYIVNNKDYIVTKGKNKGKVARNPKALDSVEIQCLNTILSDLTYKVNYYNQEFINGQKQNINVNAQEAVIKQKSVKRIKKNAANGYINYATNPRVTFERMVGYDESHPLFQHIEAIKNGETQKYSQLSRYNKPFEQFKKANKKYINSLHNKQVTFKGETISKGQYLSLFELSKRNQARQHLLKGGLTFMDENGYKHKIDNITESDLNAIESTLTAKDKEYLALIDNFYNESKQDIIKADKQNKGYTLIIDENEFYYPINSDFAANYKGLGSKRQGEFMKPSSASFNQAIVKGANNEIIISNIDSTMVRYAREVSNYCCLENPINNLERLLNRKIDITRDYTLSEEEYKEQQQAVPEEERTTAKKVSLLQELSYTDVDAFGYINQWIADMISPTQQDKASKYFSILRRNYARFQLGANAKVWLSQLSSVPTMAATLGWGNVLKAFSSSTNIIGSKALTQEMFKYSPYVEYRNSNGGSVTAESALNEYNKVMDIFTAPTQWFDNIAIKHAWISCKYAIMEKYGVSDMANLTETQLQEAGKLLEDTVRKTQPNFNASEKSAFARSKNGVVQLFTMFTTQPLQNLSLLVEGVEKLSYLNKTKASEKSIKTAQKELFNRATGAGFGVLMYSLIGLAFKEMLKKLNRGGDDDEDEDKAKQLSKDFFGMVGDSLAGMLPFVRDIYSAIAKDYSSGTYVSESIDAIGNIGKFFINAAKGNVTEASIRNAIYGLGTILGFPTRNLYKYVSATVDKFDPSTALQMDSLIYDIDTSNYVKAIAKETSKGKTDKAASLTKTFLKDKKNISLENNKVFEEYSRLVSLGYSTNLLPKTANKTFSLYGESYTLDNRQYKKFTQEYSSAMDKKMYQLIMSKQYQQLEDEVKVKAIKYISDAYYEKILCNNLSVSNRNKISSIIGNSNSHTMAIAIAYINSLSSDEKGKKKDKALAYIKKTRLTTTEKYIVLAICGYKSQNAYNYITSHIKSVKGLTKNDIDCILDFATYNK